MQERAFQRGKTVSKALRLSLEHFCRGKETIRGWRDWSQVSRETIRKK